MWNMKIMKATTPELIFRCPNKANGHLQKFDLFKD